MLKGAIPATGACLLGLALWLVSEKETTAPAGSSIVTPKIGHDVDGMKTRTKGSRRTNTATNVEEDVLAMLRSPETEGRHLALEVLLPDLIGTDIVKAAERVATLEPWASADDATRILLDAWAGRDPEAASAWCRERPDHAARERWLAYACNKAAANDPAAAMRIAERHEIAKDSRISGQVLHHWAKSDLPAAMQWIESQTDVALRDDSWRSLLMSISESDPRIAATLAADQISCESIQEEAVISVLHQWILKDRNAAASWVALFPEGPLRTRAEEELHGLN